MEGTIGSLPVRDAASEAERRVFAGLTLATLEALSGRTAAALAACERAVAAAQGSHLAPCMVAEGFIGQRCIGALRPDMMSHICTSARSTPHAVKAWYNLAACISSDLRDMSHLSTQRYEDSHREDSRFGGCRCRRAALTPGVGRAAVAGRRRRRGRLRPSACCRRGGSGPARPAAGLSGLERLG